MTILIIEDDLGIIELLKGELEEDGFAVDGVHSAEEALNYLKEKSPYLMVLDYGLQDMSGMEFISEVRKRDLSCPPFLVATGQGDEHIAVQMMKMGAKDYVVKDSNFLLVMPSVIKRICRQIENEKKLKKAEEELRISEALKTALLDGINNNISFVNDKLEIIWVNKTAAESIKKNPENMIGKTCHSLWADPEKPCDDCPTIRSFKSKKSEYSTIVTPDGRIWNESSEPLFDSSGKLLGVVEIAQDITTSKQAEEKLVLSQTRYKALFDHSPIAIWEKDFSATKIYLDSLKTQGVTDFKKYFLEHPKEVSHCLELEKIVSVNQTAVTLYRAVDKTELIAKAIHTFAEEDSGTLIGALVSLAEGNHEFERESIQRKLTGECFYARIKSFVPPHEKNTFSQVLISVIDISESKRNEEALRENEERYRLIAENTADTITVYDLNLKCIYVSPSVFKMHGYTVEEFPNVAFEKLLTPESFNYMRVIYKTEMELEKRSNADPNRSRVIELEEYHKNGSTFWIETSLSFIRDSRGKAISIMAVSKDITERKLSDITLRKLSQAVEQSPSIVVITDTMGNIEYVNPKFTEITGYLPNEIIGQNPRILKSGEIPREEYKILWDTIINGKEWRGEFHNKKKDGTLYWESAAISPIKDIEGRITHFLALKEDITQRKQTEIERENLRNQLLQSQKMESVGRLAGGVAHDFNNMLGVIYGHADLALEEMSKSDPLYRHLEQIKNAAEKSANLTHQLLAFARKQSIAPKIVDINDSISNMLKMLRRLIGEEITLAWMPGADLWSIKIDPSQVDQIMANLCVNARDAISGIGKITIGTGNVYFNVDYCLNQTGYLNGEFVQITISDTGCGMDDETLSLIFEPFFTTKAVGKGTGLGLATVYGIVQQNLGFIDVVSRLGEGSTFKIFLPKFAGITDEDNNTTKLDMLRGNNEVVLIVEDEQNILDMSVMLLENIGYRVLAASSPKEALRIAQENKENVQLLITDVIMPEMNGKDLSQKMQIFFPKMNVLFMSGYTADILSPHGVLDEGINFIHKPFAMKEFANKIREALAEKQLK